MNGSRRATVPAPPPVGADRVARGLRTSVVMGHAYSLVVPVGLLIVVFFIPKFVRNARRPR